MNCPHCHDTGLAKTDCEIYHDDTETFVPEIVPCRFCDEGTKRAQRLSCMWCGHEISALNPCDNLECVTQTERMASASAALTASFIEHPASDWRIKRGFWRLSIKDHIEEAEAMEADQ